VNLLGGERKNALRVNENGRAKLITYRENTVIDCIHILYNAAFMTQI